MTIMNGKRVIFLYPKVKLEQIEVLKKHIIWIEKNEDLPVVIVLKELCYRRKEYLIREKIPFIVEGKQIYLPFMAIYLQERCDADANFGKRECLFRKMGMPFRNKGNVDSLEVVRS